MKASFYFKRIINDKIKLFFIIFIFILPILNLMFSLIYIPVGSTPDIPSASLFLAGTSGTFIFHTLLLNFLPLYLLMISGDDCFEDYSTKYRNVLISKWGKKNYIFTNVKKAFCISFFVIFAALMLDVIMSYVILHGAVYSPYKELLLNEDPNSLFYIEVTHPFVTNIIYILATSLLSGAIGAAGAALAMAIKNRKIVYPLLFLMWFLPQQTDKSINLSLQPFCEYGLDTKLPVYFITIGIFAIATVAAVVKEVRYAKI